MVAMTTTENSDDSTTPDAGTPVHETNWQALAEFWQVKYFEQLIHSTQVITALSQDKLGGIAKLRQQAKQAAAKTGVQQ